MRGKRTDPEKLAAILEYVLKRAELGTPKQFAARIGIRLGTMQQILARRKAKLA